MNFFDPLLSSMSKSLTRRDFVRRAGGCCALTSTAILSTLLNLRMTSKVLAAPALGPLDDYKALICLFMFGGNDSCNMLAPYDDDEHAQYVAKRGGLVAPATGGTPGGLAWPKNDPDHPSYNLRPITATTGPNAGRTFGLIHSMPNLHSLYTSGRAAFLANTGTLVRRTSRVDYDANMDLPKGLFSHSDGPRNWQTSIPQSRSAAKGWAGRIADLLTDPVSPNTIAMSIAVDNWSILQNGETVVPYVIDNFAGARELDSYPSTGNAYNRIRNSMMDDIFPKDDGTLAATYADLLQRTHATANRYAIEAAIEYNKATGNISFNTQFPASELGKQVRQVARAIAARKALGHQRQIFFVYQNGFDDHDNLVRFNGSNPSGHYARLAEVDTAIMALQNALEEIESTPGELTDNVVTFSASDFSRTLASNGNGSDHAWGGNHFVISGANNINASVWGHYPTDLRNATHPEVGDLDINHGRLIPTTSVDEYSAELATWFGIPDDSNLEIVLPNIRNFHAAGGRPIGFLR